MWLPETQKTMSICSTHVLVSSTILQQNEPGLIGEMGDSRTRTIYIHIETRAFWGIRKSVCIHTHTHIAICLKETRAN